MDASASRSKPGCPRAHAQRLQEDYRLAGGVAGAGAIGVRAESVVPAPVVVLGGSFGALAVGGRLMPLLALWSPLPDAKTNNNTAATNSAAATQPHSAFEAPVPGSTGSMSVRR